MHRITALKPQRRGPQRVNVYLDGKYAFALDATLAAPLEVGQTLSPNDEAVLHQRDAGEVAYTKVLGFLSYRPRSSAEVATYLKKRQVPAETIDTVIDRLQRAGLLDDDAFARYWVENREQFRPRGARALRSELRRKGVPPTAVEKALEGIDEAESAYRAAGSRVRRLSHLDYQAFRRRLGGFLQRRGFAYDVVRETVERLWHEWQEVKAEELL